MTTDTMHDGSLPQATATIEKPWKAARRARAKAKRDATPTIVYAIFCTRPGHKRASAELPVYVGMGRGRSEMRRFRSHRKAALGKHKNKVQTPLHRCMSKWGPDWFKVRTIGVYIDRAEANRVEAESIEKFRTLIDHGGGGMNVAPGGGASPMLTKYGRMLRRTTGKKAKHV